MSKPRPKIVPFDLHHLDVMEIRDLEKEQMSVDRYAILANNSICGSIFYDGRIIAVMGYAEIWPGCFEVWVIPSVYVAQYSRVFLRTLRGYLDRISEGGLVQRFQCPQFIDDNLNHWMRHLGFQEEGIMRKYWNGQDFKLWARIPTVEVEAPQSVEGGE